MTISIIAIKFYIMYCLFMIVLVEAKKLITARSMCNIERTPYFITIQLQLRPINDHYDCNLVQSCQ